MTKKRPKPPKPLAIRRRRSIGDKARLNGRVAEIVGGFTEVGEDGAVRHRLTLRIKHLYGYTLVVVPSYT